MKKKRKKKHQNQLRLSAVKKVTDWKDDLRRIKNERY